VAWNAGDGTDGVGRHLMFFKHAEASEHSFGGLRLAGVPDRSSISRKSAHRFSAGNATSVTNREHDPIRQKRLIL
jgi:hypothetical protein